MSAKVVVEFTECGNAVKIERRIEAGDRVSAREELCAETLLELVGAILDEAEAAVILKEGGAE